MEEQTVILKEEKTKLEEEKMAGKGLEGLKMLPWAIGGGFGVSMIR